MSKRKNSRWDLPSSDHKRFKANHSHGHQSKGWQRKWYSYEKWEAKGANSEGVVRTLLYELKAQGIISRFKQSAEFSKEDKEGADFIIWYRGHAVPLQVKSSHRAMRTHREKTVTFKPVVNANGERLEHQLLKSLRWYVARLLPTLMIGDPMNPQAPYKLTTLACYYLLEVFRANISHKPFEVGMHRDMEEALHPLVNIGFLSITSSSQSTDSKQYELTQAGFECVKWILEKRDEPKRYFMNQCKRYGPNNWKQTTESLFGYKAVALKESPLLIPEGTMDRMFWERSVY